MLYKYFLPILIYVTALPCETQMFSILAKRWNVLFATKYLTTELAHSKLHMVYLAELLVVMADGLETVRMRARRSRRWRRRRDRQRDCYQCDGRLWGVSGSAARTSLGAGAMRPSAILRIMYSAPWKYRKSVSYLSCGHHHGTSSFLTFEIFAFSCLHNIVVAYNAIFIMIYLIVFQLPFLHSVVFITL